MKEKFEKSMLKLRILSFVPPNLTSDLHHWTPCLPIWTHVDWHLSNMLADTELDGYLTVGILREGHPICPGTNSFKGKNGLTLNYNLHLEGLKKKLLADLISLENWHGVLILSHYTYQFWHWFSPLCTRVVLQHSKHTFWILKWIKLTVVRHLTSQP